MHKANKGNAGWKRLKDSDKDPGTYLQSSLDNLRNTSGKEEPGTHASQNVDRRGNH